MTAKEVKDARAKAYQYSEENKRVKEELAKRRLDGDLLMVEVGLRMKHQEMATKCNAELDSVKEEMVKSGETKLRRLNAEAVAFKALQDLKAAEDALTKEKKEQAGREDAISTSFKVKLEAEKGECSV